MMMRPLTLAVVAHLGMCLMILMGDGGDDGADDGGYGEVPPHMMETVEHLPFAGNIDPGHGYQRIVSPIESSHIGASGSGYGGGEGTSGDDVGHQLAIYGCYGEYGQQPFWPQGPQHNHH